MAGISVALGVPTSPVKAMVQSAGGAVRMPGDDLRRAIHRDGVLHGALLRYANTTMATAMRKLENGSRS